MVGVQREHQVPTAPREEHVTSGDTPPAAAATPCLLTGACAQPHSHAAVPRCDGRCTPRPGTSPGMVSAVAGKLLDKLIGCLGNGSAAVPYASAANEPYHTSVCSRPALSCSPLLSSCGRHLGRSHGAHQRGPCPPQPTRQHYQYPPPPPHRPQPCSPVLLPVTPQQDDNPISTTTTTRLTQRTPQSTQRPSSHRDSISSSRSNKAMLTDRSTFSERSRNVGCFLHRSWYTCGRQRERVPVGGVVGGGGAGGRCGVAQDGTRRREVRRGGWEREPGVQACWHSSPKLAWVGLLLQASGQGPGEAHCHAQALLQSMLPADA